ncbi:hypothetical protein Tco_0241660 [Tanacetum coccineum]
MGGCRLPKKGGGVVMSRSEGRGEMVRKVACGCHGDEGGDGVVMVVRGVGDDGDGGGFGCWWGGGEGVAAG